MTGSLERRPRDTSRPLPSTSLAVAAVALLLPPQATAIWLGGTYGATSHELVSGIWILKGSLLVVALAALALRSVPEGASARDPGPAAAGWLREDAAALIAIVALAVALRVSHLNAELWLDEIDSLTRYVALSTRELLSTYDSQNQHPLYSLLARVAWLAAGKLDWAIRMPAVAFGIGSLVAAWALGRQVASRAEGVLAALVLAVSYHHVWFSQNARGYTAMLCLTIVATAIFLRLTSGEPAHPRRLAWAYGIVMALAVYTHLTAALVAVGHGAALLAGTRWTRDGSLARRLAWPAVAIGLSALLTVCLYAPVMPQLVREVMAPTTEGAAIVWTRPQWMMGETVRVLASGFPGGVAALAAAIAVLAVGTVSHWRQSRMAVLAMVLPIVVTVVAVTALRHNLWPRFFFFAAAFIVLLAIRGGFVLSRWVFRSQGQRVAVAGALLVAGLSALTVPRAWLPKQRFLEAAEWIQRQRRSGDAVVAVDVAAYVYLLRGVPEGWQVSTLTSSIRRIEEEALRTWIVYTSPTRLRALFPEVARHLDSPGHREVRVFPSTIGDAEIRVLLLDRTGSHD